MGSLSRIFRGVILLALFLGIFSFTAATVIGGGGLLIPAVDRDDDRIAPAAENRSIGNGEK